MVETLQGNTVSNLCVHICCLGDVFIGRYLVTAVFFGSTIHSGLTVSLVKLYRRHVALFCFNIPHHSTEYVDMS
jgi:hypothetical protein